MAQKREKSTLRKLINERGIKYLAGVQDLVKELTSGLIQEIMNAELKEELGYSKYDYKNKQEDNSRPLQKDGNVVKKSYISPSAPIKRAKRTFWASRSAQRKSKSISWVCSTA